MKSRRIVGALLALGGIVATSIIGSGTANAHVSVYVAGMSGAGVDTTADGNPTYIVSFAPGHGCSGPKTAANPDGAYPTTSLEVFMPKDSAGQYILPEVRAVEGVGYTTELKTEANPDTATATKTPKRVQSIVYSGFNLKAANGGMTARNTQMFSLAVKLPKLSALQASSKYIYTGAGTSTHVEVYFPQIQYCDVTGQGVGVTTTAPSATATLAPVCSATDTVKTTLLDDWTTAGNTPKVTIGAKTIVAATTGYIDGNKTTKAVAADEYYCQGTPAVNAAKLPLYGNFEARTTGVGAKLKAVFMVDASSVHAGKRVVVRNATGKIVASGKLDKSGDFARTLNTAQSAALTKGEQLRLFIGGVLSAADAL